MTDYNANRNIRLLLDQADKLLEESQHNAYIHVN